MRDIESNPGATFECIRPRARFFSKLIHNAPDGHRMCRQDVTLVIRSTGRGAQSGLLLVNSQRFRRGRLPSRITLPPAFHDTRGVLQCDLCCNWHTHPGSAHRKTETRLKTHGRGSAGSMLDGGLGFCRLLRDLRWRREFQLIPAPTEGCNELNRCGHLRNLRID